MPPTNSAAAVLEAAQPRFSLPSRQQLDKFRRLDSDMRVAAAKLDVGLSLTLRAKRPMRISVQSDGVGETTLDLTTSTFEAGARRQMQLEIEDVAEIAISGGAADTRQESERLERLWAMEVGPGHCRPRVPRRSKIWAGCRGGGRSRHRDSVGPTGGCAT